MTEKLICDTINYDQYRSVYIFAINIEGKSLGYPVIYILKCIILRKF